MASALDRSKPLAQLPQEAMKRLRVLASDIDDTITTEGKLPAEAFAALWRAQAAGLAVVPVTGRPAGWCDHIARMWPVAGVVGENGALWFRHVGGNPGKMEREYVLDAAARAENRRKLDAVAKDILARVPGAAIASDQAYREFDLAIDFCEDVPRLPAAQVDRIVEVFREHGCTAKVSSIHVNGWFGSYDKLGMLRRFASEKLGLADDEQEDAILFCGDSPNDEPMFRHFPLSVGMANIADFRDRVVDPPGYLASRRGGAGFAETVESILRARGV